MLHKCEDVVSETVSLTVFCGWCSFGKTVRMLHPMQEIFTTESGANILRQLTF